MAAHLMTVGVTCCSMLLSFTWEMWLRVSFSTHSCPIISLGREIDIQIILRQKR